MLKKSIHAILGRKRTIYSVVFKVTNIGGQLLIIPLVYSGLGEYEFGIFATINTIAIFALNIDFGIINAIKNPLHEQLQNKNFKQASVIASTSFAFISSFSLIAILLAMVGYTFGLDKILFVAQKYESVRRVLFISIIYFFIRFNFQIVHGFNHSIGKYYVNDLLLMIGTVLSTLSLFIISKLGWLTLENVIHCYFAFYCFVYVFYFVIFKVKNTQLKLSLSFFEFPYLSDLLRKSSAFFFLQLTWIGMTNFVPLMLMREIGPSVAGKYTILSRLFNFLYVINIIILNNFWSEIHERHIKSETSGVVLLYNKVLKISFLFSIVCILIALFHQHILNLWMGKEIKIGQIFLINTLIYYVFIIVLSTVNIFMNSINKLRIQIALSFINTVLVLSIYYVLKHVFIVDLQNAVFFAPISVIFMNIVVTMVWVRMNVFSNIGSMRYMFFKLHR